LNLSQMPIEQPVEDLIRIGHFLGSNPYFDELSSINGTILLTI